MDRIEFGRPMVVALALMAAACGGGDGDRIVALDPGGNGGGNGGGAPVFPSTEYDLANRCFELLANGSPVKATETGYTAAADAAGDPVLFYMKPTALGRYVFFTADRKMLTGASDAAVTGEDAPSDGADWTLSTTAPGAYVAGVLDGKMGVADDGTLVLGADAAGLRFAQAEGCTAYPEMPVGILEAEPGAPGLVNGTYRGPQTGALVGFADIHAHMSMGSDMSDGTGDRGPSAGGVMYGHAVNRFGVIEALKDCSVIHGQDGVLSPEAIILDSNPAEAQHDTVGWPSFVSWPANDSLLHQQMYYKWVERTYKAGLRLMVMHGTNIEALCDVAKKTVGDKQADCTDMGVGMKQVAYAHDMERYIDAQEGGPGKGWFRIVKTPDEAERVIRAGKMAVVPGLEFSNIFKCNVTFLPGGEEVVGCDKDTIDQQIQEAWDAGVRGIFLYHDVDSALGGTGIFDGFALNLVNYYGTKSFWKTYTCDTEWGQEDDKGYFYGAGAEMMGASEFNSFNDPISAALAENSMGLLPLYPAGAQCNARDITDLGRYALQAAMKKGFVLDIDHAEISIKQAMLDEGAATQPAYPMISAHGGHGGITNAQALQMLKQGGIIYPGMVNGREYIGFYDKVEAIWSQMAPDEKARYPIAVGYGADQNGLANQPGPRRGEGVVPVDYADITLFEGQGWGPGFAAAGIAPLKVAQLTIENGKTWNVDENGVAHYGLIPDVIEQIRIESGENRKYLEGFYRSADAYVRLWKQTLAASEKRLDPEAPANVPPLVPHPLDPTTGPPPAP